MLLLLLESGGGRRKVAVVLLAILPIERHCALSDYLQAPICHVQTGGNSCCQDSPFCDRESARPKCRVSIAEPAVSGQPRSICSKKIKVAAEEYRAVALAECVCMCRLSSCR